MTIRTRASACARTLSTWTARTRCGARAKRWSAKTSRCSRESLRRMALDAANKDFEQIAELFHLVAFERSFEKRPVGAREFGIELAKQLDAFGAQSHRHASPDVARAESLA